MFFIFLFKKTLLSLLKKELILSATSRRYQKNRRRSIRIGINWQQSTRVSAYPFRSLLRIVESFLSWLSAWENHWTLSTFSNPRWVCWVQSIRVLGLLLYPVIMNFQFQHKLLKIWEARMEIGLSKQSFYLLAVSNGQKPKNNWFLEMMLMITRYISKLTMERILI